jgi:protein phosphatase
MATTLVGAVVRDGVTWIANAGDSRGYVFDARLHQITSDHSLVAEQFAAGTIASRGAALSEHRNVITRGIGVEETVVPDVFGPIEMAPGSTLLLCSDGVYKVLREAAIVLALREDSAMAAAARLVAMANKAGGPDNIAVALCRIAGSPRGGAPADATE